MGDRMMLVEKSFDNGEVVLNYAEGPDNGPPIIFLHGFGETWQGFIPLLSTLNKSGRTPEHYNLKDYLLDITSFAQKQINKPSFIYGHSLGGMIAYMMAANHPEHVRGLIIGDSPQSPFRPREGLRSWWKNVKAIAETGDSVMESYGKRRNESLVAEGLGVVEDPIFDFYNLATWSHLDPDTCTPWIDASENEDVFNSLFEGYDSGIFSRISCPVLHLQAVNRVDDLEGLPNVVIKTYDLPHDLHLVKPEQILRDVTYFLESLR
jgi:pimeloyl-ACP methyl ester carboxylesterase